MVRLGSGVVQLIAARSAPWSVLWSGPELAWLLSAGWVMVQRVLGVWWVWLLAPCRVVRRG